MHLRVVLNLIATRYIPVQFRVIAAGLITRILPRLINYYPRQFSDASVEIEISLLGKCCDPNYELFNRVI